jgi:TM2 domain-containing membrane protein YozV
MSSNPHVYNFPGDEYIPDVPVLQTKHVKDSSSSIHKVGHNREWETRNTSAFNQYEEEKLDKAEALAWSLFIPGGGLFYAKDPGAGILCFGATVAAFVLIKELPGLIIGLVIIRIIEIANTFSLVDEYNRYLRLDLKLTYDDFKKQPVVCLSVNF